MDLSTANAAAGHNHREAAAPVAAAALILDSWRPAKLTHPYHQRLIEEAALG